MCKISPGYSLISSFFKSVQSAKLLQKRANSANERKVFFQIVVNLIKNGKNFETCILDKLTKYFIGRNINIVSQFMEMEEEQQARDLEIRQVIESSYLYYYT